VTAITFTRDKVIAQQSGGYGKFSFGGRGLAICVQIGETIGSNRTQIDENSARARSSELLTVKMPYVSFDEDDNGL
jgi:hypothetical protein